MQSNPETHAMVRRSQSRNMKDHEHMSLAILASEINVPRNYQEAIDPHNEFREEWIKAVQAELNNLKSKKTWQSAQVTDRVPLSTTWVFAVKENADCERRTAHLRVNLRARDERTY